MGCPGRLPFLLWAAALLLLLLSGCAGHQRALLESHALAGQGRFDDALARLDRSELARSSGSRLLYLMERGLFLHLKGEYRESNVVFDEAEVLAEELYTRSLSAESASLLTNDTVIPYAGENFESVYLHYYKILNYLALDEPASARIEARKIDEKLTWFADRFEGRSVYREDAFLRLLTGLIYEVLGEPGEALVAYRKSLGIYEEFAKKYGVPVPDALRDRLLACARVTGSLEEEALFLERFERESSSGSPPGAIVVLVDQGSVPVKREAFVLIPTAHGFPVKVAVPEFISRPGSSGKVEMALNGGPWIPVEMVQDIGAIARQTLEDRKGLVVTKAVARAAGKQVAARAVEQKQGELAGFLAQLAALLTERADLRSWTSLPAVIRMAVIPAEPGEHTVTLRAENRTETLSVTVQEGSLGFISLRFF